MLDKRLDLVVADARAVEPDPVERLAEQVAHEREVLARLVLVQRLELDVARRRGLHVGERAREREQPRRVGGVRDEGAHGVQEEPEGGRLRARAP